MLPASTKQDGQCLGTPDVCNTPSPAGPVPIPYPNIGMVNQASKTATKVKFVGKLVVHIGSEIPSSSGDEAGTNGGVVSGSNMDKVTFTKGSANVKIEGQDCIHQSSVSAHNGASANMPGGSQIAPSQTKVLVMP